MKFLLLKNESFKTCPLLLAAFRKFDETKRMTILISITTAKIQTHDSTEILRF